MCCRSESDFERRSCAEPEECRSAGGKGGVQAVLHGAICI